MSEIPLNAKGRRPRFFEADGVDELVSMVLEILAEISTLQERQYVTERVLEKSGLKLGEEIERYRLSANDREALAADRDRMLQTVLRVLETAPAEESSQAGIAAELRSSRAA